MPSLFNIEPYFDILNRGETVITANARQCAKMRASYSKLCSQTQTVVPYPKLYSLNAWLEQQWLLADFNNLAGTDALVLNANQRKAVWLDVLTKQLAVSPLLSGEQMAPLADSAYKTLELWQIDPEQLDWQDAYYQNFKQWFIAFAQELKQKNWMTAESRQKLLLDSFKSSQLPKTDDIHLVGFDDIPPLTAALLEQASLRLLKHNPPQQQSTIKREIKPTRRDEIVAAAQWAKNLLEQDNALTIGIIAPNLGQIRDLVEQVFIETFDAHLLNAQTARYTAPFNFSAGTPLGQAPIINVAFCLLRVLTQDITFDQLAALLCSPFWLAAEFRNYGFTALALASNNPKENYRWADVKRLFELCDEKFKQDCPSQLLIKLVEVDHSYRHSDKQLSPAVWADFILELLQALGWPGKRTLDSVEYQQVSQFQTLLEDFVSIGQVKPLMGFTEQLNFLQQTAQKTPFQAQTPESPIQILGILEGAALNYDYCWVLNMDNQIWPPQPTPNPLLPVPMQRELDMPNASAVKQLRYAQSLMNQISVAAPTVVFSHALMDGDSELNPSGLIKGIPPNSLGEASTDQIAKTPLNIEFNKLFDNHCFTWRDCQMSVPLPEDQHQPGGVSVLQWQAAMPFNGFCRYRLGLTPLPQIQHHLSPAERGQITHQALANFWQLIRTQSALLSLSEHELSHIVNDCVAKALEQLAAIFAPFTPSAKKLEAARQKVIIKKWLEIERQRPNFAVTATEQAVEVVFAGLQFNLRLDRLDQQDDQYIIIDYKAGSQQSAKHWLPERITAPQLPLYALEFPEPINAISYGIVNGSKQAFVGVGDLNSPVTGINSSEKIAEQSWQDLKESWRQDLATIAEEFKNGVAHCVEYHPEVTRHQQDYLAINRLNEKATNYQLWLAEGNHE